MSLIATIVSVSIALANASHLSDSALQHIDAKHVGTVEAIGNFFQQHNLPAPWMNQARHLQAAAEPPLVIPAACKAACAGIDTLVKGLETKMMTAMQPHMAAMGPMMTPSAAGAAADTPAQMAAKMKGMEPAFQALMTVVFQDMCDNRATYQCMATNSAKCFKADPNVVSLGVSFNNPMEMAKTYGSQLGCMCDACPASKAAYAEMNAKMMSFMMTALISALSGLAGGGGATAAKPTSGATDALGLEMKESLLKAFCPIVPVMRCFSANPTVCASMMSQGMAKTGEDALKVTFTNGTSEMAAQCKTAGISTTSAALPVVSQKVTITGLVFAKVASNPTLKANIIAKVIAVYLAKPGLAGYTAGDITVTLSAGSVVANVVITPLPGSSPEKLQAAVSAGGATSTAAAVVASVKTVSGLEAATAEGTTVATLTAKADVAAKGKSVGTTVSGSFNAGVVGTVWVLLAQAALYTAV